MAIAHLHSNRAGTEPDIQALERRLVDGERKIALAEARGEDTTRLTDFWIDLLHQYESAVDSLPEAA
jgi:hypothetical protein